MLFCEHWGLNTHLKNDFNLNEIFVRSQLSVKTSVHRSKASSTPSLCCSVWYTHVSHNTGFITVAYSIHRLLLADKPAPSFTVCALIAVTPEPF